MTSERKGYCVRNRRWLYGLFGMSVHCILGVGCDYVAHGTQTVMLRVLDANKDTPLDAAQVVCAPARRPGPKSVKLLSEPEYLARYAPPAETTDCNGRLALTLKTSTLQGGIRVALRKPTDRLLDEVTGRSYLCEIRHRDRAELMLVLMREKSESRGTAFVVCVECIGRPIPEENPR